MTNEYLKRLSGLLSDRSEVGPNAWCQGARAVKDWLQQLPLGNPENHAHRLLDGLKEMNDTRVDAGRRLDGLEVFRVALGNSVAALARQIRDETFPLPPSRMHIGATIQQFEREIVAGYLRVVCDLVGADGSVSFLRRSSVALALTRAIQHQSARLRVAYQTHSAPQIGVWQGLHDMFRFAAAVACDTKAQPDPLLAGIKIDARGAYTQAILHAFAQPYHFIPAHNIELHAALPVLASLCAISQGEAGEGAIAFCTEGDHAPPSPPRGREIAPDALWRLEVSALLRALQAHEARAATVHIESRAGSVELHTDLAHRLVTAWSGRVEREFPRSMENREFDTLIGLQSVHAALCGMSFESFALSARPFEDDGRSAIWAGADSDAAHTSRARLLDRGLGGWRLRWNAGQDLRARVGEVIALSPAEGQERERDWIVGIVRWLRVDALGAVEAGVEMLGRDANPVSVASVDAKGIVRTPMRGLLVLPPQTDGAGKIEPYIAVPHLFDREAMAVELLHFDGVPNQDNARLQTISDMRIRANGDLYLRIVLPLPTASNGDGNAANDDARHVIQFPQRNPQTTAP